MVSRDQRAHFTARHLNTVFGGIQVALDPGDIGVQPVHIVRIGFRGQLCVHRLLQSGNFPVHRNG